MSAVANPSDRMSGFFTQGLAEADPAVVRHHPGRAEPPARQDRADRLREHRLQGGAGSPGLGADQQICRRLSRQALLWRLRICRCRPSSWPSTAPASCSAAAYANVQPHSGANANQAVFYALLQPGDTFMGLDLAAGGHLTHGHPANYSGKWFKPVPYTVRADDQRIDMDEVAALAREHKPKLIMAGGSAYARIIDFAALPRDRRRSRRLFHGRHGAFRRPGGGRRASQPARRMPMW